MAPWPLGLEALTARPGVPVCLKAGRASGPGPLDSPAQRNPGPHGMGDSRIKRKEQCYGEKEEGQEEIEGLLSLV